MDSRFPHTWRLTGEGRSHWAARLLGELRWISTRRATLDAPLGLQDLARKLNAPLSLKEAGIREIRLDRAADLAVAKTLLEPRPIARDDIRKLHDDAFRGRRRMLE